MDSANKNRVRGHKDYDDDDWIQNTVGNLIGSSGIQSQLGLFMHRKQIGFSGRGLVVAGIGMSSINHRGSMWFFGQQVNRANVARRVKQFKLSWVEKGQS